MVSFVIITFEGNNEPIFFFFLFLYLFICESHAARAQLSSAKMGQFQPRRQDAFFIWITHFSARRTAQPPTPQSILASPSGSWQPRLYPLFQKIPALCRRSFVRRQRASPRVSPEARRHSWHAEGRGPTPRGKEVRLLYRWRLRRRKNREIWTCLRVCYRTMTLFSLLDSASRASRWESSESPTNPFLSFSRPDVGVLSLPFKLGQVESKQRSHAQHT